MSTRSADMKTWLSVYPVAEETADSGLEDVVFVDVGGTAIFHKNSLFLSGEPGSF